MCEADVSYSKTVDHRSLFSAKTGILPKTNIVFDSVEFGVLIVGAIADAIYW